MTRHVFPEANKAHRREHDQVMEIEDEERVWIPSLGDEFSNGGVTTPLADDNRSLHGLNGNSARHETDEDMQQPDFRDIVNLDNINSEANINDLDDILQLYATCGNPRPIGSEHEVDPRHLQDYFDLSQGHGEHPTRLAPFASDARRARLESHDLRSHGAGRGYDGHPEPQDEFIVSHNRPPLCFSELDLDLHFGPRPGPVDENELGENVMSDFLLPRVLRFIHPSHWLPLPREGPLPSYIRPSFQPNWRPEAPSFSASDNLRGSRFIRAPRLPSEPLAMLMPSRLGSRHSPEPRLRDLDLERDYYDDFNVGDLEREFRALEIHMPDHLRGESGRRRPIQSVPPSRSAHRRSNGSTCVVLMPNLTTDDEFVETNRLIRPSSSWHCRPDGRDFLRTTRNLITDDSRTHQVNQLRGPQGSSLGCVWIQPSRNWTRGPGGLIGSESQSVLVRTRVAGRAVEPVVGSNEPSGGWRRIR